MDHSNLSSAPGSVAGRRGLFTEVEPFAFGWLKTGDGHEVYYEQSGNPNGRAAIVLHGGPGGATNSTMRRFFNPDKWRTVMFDQRGCGKSRPHASLENNTTWDLVADIERIREHLGVEKWCVFGGSWGSTLALAYAIKHPERVESLVLRGIFLLTQKELRWFYQEGASAMFPDAWTRYLAPIPEGERGDLMAAYHKRLTGTDRKAQEACAAAWSQWEGDTISLRGPEARPSKFNEIDFTIAFARIECHYFVNGGFLPHDGWLLEQAPKLRHIPTWIVQGRFDVVTPLETAWALKQALPDAHFEIVWDAGHASTEPGVIDGLVRATEKALKV